MYALDGACAAGTTAGDALCGATCADACETGTTNTQSATTNQRKDINICSPRNQKFKRKFRPTLVLL